MCHRSAPTLTAIFTPSPVLNSVPAGVLLVSPRKSSTICLLFSKPPMDMTTPFLARMFTVSPALSISTPMTARLTGSWNSFVAGDMYHTSMLSPMDMTLLR